MAVELLKFKKWLVASAPRRLLTVATALSVAAISSCAEPTGSGRDLARAFERMADEATNRGNYVRAQTLHGAAGFLRAGAPVQDLSIEQDGVSLSGKAVILELGYAGGGIVAHDTIMAFGVIAWSDDQASTMWSIGAMCDTLYCRPLTAEDSLGSKASIYRLGTDVTDYWNLETASGYVRVSSIGNRLPSTDPSYAREAARYVMDVHATLVRLHSDPIQRSDVRMHGNVAGIRYLRRCTPDEPCRTELP